MNNTTTTTIRDIIERIDITNTLTNYSIVLNLKNNNFDIVLVKPNVQPSLSSSNLIVINDGYKF